MKRLSCVILILCFLLSGCGMFGERLREPVTFYYLQSEFQHGSQEPVFVSEQREASGHRHDLNYLLALYLMGPSSEDLISPLPKGTRIYMVVSDQNALSLELSDTSKTLSDIQYTLACTCLSLTCFELTQTEAVTITSGERSITMTRDDLVLVDAEPTEGTK